METLAGVSFSPRENRAVLRDDADDSLGHDAYTRVSWMCRLGLSRFRIGSQAIQPRSGGYDERGGWFQMLVLLCSHASISILVCRPSSETDPARPIAV